MMLNFDLSFFGNHLNLAWTIGSKGEFEFDEIHESVYIEP